MLNRITGVIRRVVLIAAVLVSVLLPVSDGHAAGNVWAWGSNTYGQLGDNSTSNNSTPLKINSIPDVVMVSAGSNHSVALKSNGTVWAWGKNSFGQVGDGTTTIRKTPVQVSGLSGVIQVSAADDFTLALKSDGTVWGWGLNASGQLGDGTTSVRHMPVQAEGLTGILYVAAGIDCSFVVKSDGTVWAWGANQYGKLGNGTTASSMTPVQVAMVSAITKVVAGWYFTAALKSDGTVWMWGRNDAGQLGDGTTSDRHTPYMISGLSPISDISAGASHILALVSNGEMYAWGGNNYGQLGVNSTAASHVPVKVKDVAGTGLLTGVTKVAAGNLHSLAIINDGEVYAWGCNGNGQVGDGTNTNRLLPKLPILTANVSDISAGVYFTLAAEIIETDPPVSTVINPLDGVTLPDGLDSYTIRGTASDGAGSGVAYVDVTMDGGTTWKRALGTDSWSYDWTIPVNGNYCIKSRAADYANNIETPGACANVTVNNSPMSTILLPLDMVAIPLALGSYSITGATVDRSGTGVNKVEVSTDGGSTWYDAVDGPGDGSWTWWSYQWAPLTEGTFNIKARGTDNAANTATGGSGITVFVDGTVPSSSITDPADGAVLELSAGTYTITGSASDSGGSGVMLVEVSTDGGSTWNTATGTGPWSYDWPIPSTGAFTILTRATDRVGLVETPGAGNGVTVNNTVPEFLWTRQMGSPGADHAMDVATDDGGNSYVVGYTGGGMDGYSSSGGADMFVTKYNAGGVKLWTRQLGTPSYDYAMGVALDPDRNVYITGYTGGDFDGHANSGGSDAFMVVYDTNGNKLGSGLSGDPDDDWGRKVAVAHDGSVYMAGYSSPGGGDYDARLTKLNADTTVVWTRTLGSTANDYAFDVDVDPSGNAYITGYASGSVSSQPFGGGTDILVVKYLSNGVRQWTKLLGGPDYDRGTGVAFDGTGYLSVTGYTDGGVDGNSNIGEMDPFLMTYPFDTILARYAPDGSKVWTVQGGSTANDLANGVFVDEAGCTYVTGKTDGGMYGNSNAGAYDIFVTKYNSTGIRLWTKQMGTSANDQAFGVSADGRGCVYLAGSTFGSLDGANAGSYDMFVSKIGELLDTYITDPLDGGIITASSYTVKGLSYDYSGNGVQTVEVSTDNGGTWDTATDTSGDGSWSAWEYLWAPAPLGNRTILARATDTLATVEDTPAQAIVMVDYEDPASAIIAPLTGAAVNGLTLMLSGTSTDFAGSGVALVEVSTDGGANWAAATGTGSWNYVWTLPADGEYTLYSRATDIAGNIESPSSAISVRVDNTPPDSAVTSPLDGAAFKGANYTITGTANDGAGSGVSQVEVSTDGGTTWNPVAGTGSWSYDWALPADGVYNIVSRATDNATNLEAQGAGISVTVDNTPPVAVITDPSAGTDVSTVLYELLGTSTDAAGSGVTQVEVSTDGGSNWTGASGTDTWSLNWNVPGPGSYNLKVRATDAVGNTGDPGLGIDVDATTVISAGRASVAINYTLGRPGPITSVTVSGDPWDVTVDSSGSRAWLGGAPASTTTPDDVTVAVDPATFVIGNYTGTLVISSALASNSPLGVPVSITVSGSVVTSELTHDNWNQAITGGSCDICHAAPNAFIPAGYDMQNEASSCVSCHNLASVAHESGDSSRLHSIFVNATAGGCVLPTYGNVTSATGDNRPYANLGNGGNVVCATCHNAMGKTEDYGRVWEMTVSSDRRTYYMTGGGWANYGRMVPSVYRSGTLMTAPTYVKDRATYLVDPSEYSYDETAGSVTFAAQQATNVYVYVTLEYPYLRASSESNRLCSDCHTQTTHMGINCMTCHASHGSGNLAGVRGTIRATDMAELPVDFTSRTGQGSFADGGPVHDGICEVCHTQTLHHTRTGTELPEHGDLNDYTGTDCTTCHPHSSGFMY